MGNFVLNDLSVLKLCKKYAERMEIADQKNGNYRVRNNLTEAEKNTFPKFYCHQIIKGYPFILLASAEILFQKKR